ncbi:response regulator [Azospirillum canadense]|uniref:hypothetical protein n=1 Tax=Azospirillum canadense TaxID=403962 RepID=UPI002225EB09|nr:hypothetical protein [Azospirillum canadense]MCW2240524.1 DNA-binding response OmpR family regulator [Azospirillum canadense]
MTSLAGSTVLIAEPYASVASGLRLIIEQWGGCCRTVLSAGELHVALQCALPDVLLVNIDLVGGSEGVEALSRAYSTAVVVMAARFLGKDEREAVACLEMPFTIADLQLAIRSASARLLGGAGRSVRGLPGRAAAWAL